MLKNWEAVLTKAQYQVRRVTDRLELHGHTREVGLVLEKQGWSRAGTGTLYTLEVEGIEVSRHGVVVETIWPITKANQGCENHYNNTSGVCFKYNAAASGVLYHVVVMERQVFKDLLCL